MRSLSLLALSLSLYLPHALAEPIDKHLLERALVKRKGAVSYDANCDEAPPSNSGYKPPGFPTKKSVLEKAYSNTVELATGAADIAQDSKAFSHYFGGDKTEDQHKHFKAMMSGVKEDTDQYFSIQFECSGTGDDCKNIKDASVAVTDASEGGPNDQKIIQICPSFWTSRQTRFLLYDSSKGDSPGVPYRDKSSSGWCDKDKDGVSKQKADFFNNAGHSLLHELTHLDSLAKQAGLEAPGGNGEDANRHGTDDAQDGKELLGARAHLKAYKQDNGITSPDYNAESYAAAATEAYFMKLCDFKEIAPKEDEAATETTTPPPPPEPTQTDSPPPPPPAYATGTCCFHLTETETCATDDKNLYGHVKLVDNKKDVIGETESELGLPMNDNEPYRFGSKLKHELVITGEHQNDYVQFNINGLDWKSTEPKNGASCDVGGWDPREGPTCLSGRVPITRPAKNNMDCCFPCDGET